MNNQTILGRFLIWRIRHVRHRQFVLLLSVVIGILSGVSAVVLKNIVHLINHFTLSSLNGNNLHYIILVLPFLGIILTYLYVKYSVKDNIGHGVSKVLFAISKKNGNLKPHNTYTSLIASAFTVSLGGSVGLEAPIVLTGSAIGSNISRALKLNYRTTILLIGCGAAGAVAGIFKAPIAALVFGLEVLMLDLTMASIIPLLISAFTGTLVAYFLMGEGVIFSFALESKFDLAQIPYFVSLGLLCGVVSTFFTRITLRIESFIGKIKSPWVKIAIGGGILGLLIYLFPPLYGEGYDVLRDIIHNQTDELFGGSIMSFLDAHKWGIAIFLILTIIFKPIASSFTTGSGGIGGVFAPALFIGGILGFVLAHILNILDFAQLPEENFALAGMAGIMAGIMHAPLTAIFLIAEITGGYGLFIPLILTSTISYLTIMYFEPHSIYTKRLARRGELLTHNKDQAILRLIDISKIIEKDFKKIHPEQTLRELVKIVSKSNRNIFPVIDDTSKLIGIVLLDNIREIIFNTELYDTVTVNEMMILPPALISIQDNMEEVLQKFKETGAWNLPVTKDEKYVGFISKSKLFSVYRRWLVDISQT